MIMNKEALRCLKERRSIRQFKKEQIKPEELDAILEAGTYAPTGMGKQSPYIVAVQNPDDVAAMNELNKRFMTYFKGDSPYYGAPTIVFVLAERDNPISFYDACAVGTNIVNAAYAVGLGSCWIHRSKEMFDSDEGKAYLKKWGMPDGLMGVCSFAIGYADCELPEPKPRKEGYITKV